jgi:hypothetical protein
VPSSCSSVEVSSNSFVMSPHYLDTQGHELCSRSLVQLFGHPPIHSTTFQLFDHPPIHSTTFRLFDHPPIHSTTFQPHLSDMQIHAGLP